MVCSCVRHVWMWSNMDANKNWHDIIPLMLFYSVGASYSSAVLNTTVASIIQTLEHQPTWWWLDDQTWYLMKLMNRSPDLCINLCMNRFSWHSQDVFWICFLYFCCHVSASHDVICTKNLFPTSRVGFPTWERHSHEFFRSEKHFSDGSDSTWAHSKIQDLSYQVESSFNSFTQ